MSGFFKVGTYHYNWSTIRRSVGGHGDVFSGESPWTVTGPLFDLLDLLVFSCSLVMLMLDLNAFHRRQPTRTGLTGMLTSAQLLSG